MTAEPAASAIRIEVRSGIDPALDDVAGGAEPRHAFLRRAWFAAVAGKAATTLVASRANGQPILALPSVRAAPLVRSVPGSYWPIRSFPILADTSDAELCAILADPETRRAIGPVLRIGPVNVDDPTMARLIEVAPASGWTLLTRRLATSYGLDIEAARRAGPWPRPSTLKKNRFHEKHLAAHGPLDWRFVSGDGWTREIFDDLAAIERRSWLGKDGGDAKFLDARQRCIWERALQDAGLAAMMTVGMLYVAGKPAAFSFGIEAGRTRYCIATSYDRRFAKHSPGKLLSYRTYVDAAARGIALLDDGAGDAGHKSVMGEAPGPDIIDCLLVRGALLPILLQPLWRRSGQ